MVEGIHGPTALEAWMSRDAQDPGVRAHGHVRQTHRENDTVKFTAERPGAYPYVIARVERSCHEQHDTGERVAEGLLGGNPQDHAR